MRIHQVDIDRQTGEWISQPVDLCESTTAEDWNARADSDDFHYDTAEIVGETVALVCRYVD